MLDQPRLEAALDSLEAAIMVRDAAGRLLYANQAAAELLRLPDVEALRALTPEETMALFDAYREREDPLSLDQLPSARILADDLTPEPMNATSIWPATSVASSACSSTTGSCTSSKLTLPAPCRPV